MKKNKILLIILIILIIISVGVYYTVKYFMDKDIENLEQELQETIDTLGVVEEENVTNLVAKFNTEIMENGIEYPASEDYFTTYNNQYWYGMYDDIDLVIIPEEFTGDMDKDIVNTMLIRIPKDSENEEMALEYFKNLIRTNNNEITDEDISYLIEEANVQKVNGRNANNGKGIYVGVIEGDDHYEYQVIRIM